MKKAIAIVGLAALVSVGAYNMCNSIPEERIISVHNSDGTLNDGTGYTEGFEIRYDGEGHASARLSSHVTSRNGKRMPELNNVIDLEIGKFPYTIRIMHLLPIQILESRNPESLDGAVIDFVLESKNAQVKQSPVSSYIMMNRSTIEQYRREWQAWREFNKPIPKRY